MWTTAPFLHRRRITGFYLFPPPFLPLSSSPSLPQETTFKTHYNTLVEYLECFKYTGSPLLFHLLDKKPFFFILFLTLLFSPFSLPPISPSMKEVQCKPLILWRELHMKWQRMLGKRESDIWRFSSFFSTFLFLLSLPFSVSLLSDLYPPSPSPFPPPLPQGSICPPLTLQCGYG